MPSMPSRLQAHRQGLLRTGLFGANSVQSCAGMPHYSPTTQHTPSPSHTVTRAIWVKGCRAVLTANQGWVYIQTLIVARTTNFLIAVFREYAWYPGIVVAHFAADRTLPCTDWPVLYAMLLPVFIGVCWGVESCKGGMHTAAAERACLVGCGLLRLGGVLVQLVLNVL